MNRISDPSMSIPLIDPNVERLEIIVPQCLREAFAANMHLLPKFANQIQSAVQQSFEHPDTRLKGEIRKKEVNLRVNLCYEAMRQMYHELKLSLTQSMDILPGVLIDALRMGDGLQEQFDGLEGNDRWAPSNQQAQECILEDTNLNE